MSNISEAVRTVCHRSKLKLYHDTREISRLPCWQDGVYLTAAEILQNIDDVIKSECRKV